MTHPSDNQELRALIEAAYPRLPTEEHHREVRAARNALRTGFEEGYRAAESHLSASKGDGWRTMESAPRDGRLVLLAVDPREKVGTPAWTGIYCAYWDNLDEFWKFHREGYVSNPVLWRALDDILPPAPDGQSQDAEDVT